MDCNEKDLKFFFAYFGVSTVPMRIIVFLKKKVNLQFMRTVKETF